MFLQDACPRKRIHRLRQRLLLDTFPRPDMECALLFLFYDFEHRRDDHNIMYILYVRLYSIWYVLYRILL